LRGAVLVLGLWRRLVSMKKRRWFLTAAFAVLVLAILPVAAAEPEKTAPKTPLEVTYYYLPG
jgi:hypothetical protein